MKKVELLERVQKKIDELGTMFTEKQYVNGKLLGKPLCVNHKGNTVGIIFGNSHWEIGTSNNNPEKVVEEFYNAYKFN